MWLSGCGVTLWNKCLFFLICSQIKSNQIRFSCSFRTQTFAYPESPAEREEILQGLAVRIEDIRSVSVNQSTEHLHNRRWTRNPRLVATQTASPPTLTSLRAAGDVADGDLPAAAADEGRGRAAPVEGARAKVQGGADGAQSLQPVGHRQMPDRRGLVSHRQVARAAERSARGRGKKAKSHRVHGKVPLFFF